MSTAVKEGEKPALITDSFMVWLRDAIGRKGTVSEPIAELVDYSLGDEAIVQEGALKSGVREIVCARRSGRSLLIWGVSIGSGVVFKNASALAAPAQ